MLVDGVKIVYPDGWALVLPDPELAVTHVWAEGASDAEARRLVAIHAGQVAELTVTVSEGRSSSRATYAPGP